MKAINLFYQGEGRAQMEHLEMDDATTFGQLKVQLTQRYGADDHAHLFMEDDDELVDETRPLGEFATKAGLKVHLHRCRHVEITVSFNGKSVERRFAPSATIGRVKRWAAERKFGMTHDDATDHSLQLSGTHTQPAANVHVGTLTDGKVCGLAFDLVPDPRVQGEV